MGMGHHRGGNEFLLLLLGVAARFPSTIHLLGADVELSSIEFDLLLRL